MKRIRQEAPFNGWSLLYFVIGIFNSPKERALWFTRDAKKNLGMFAIDAKDTNFIITPRITFILVKISITLNSTAREILN